MKQQKFILPIIIVTAIILTASAIIYSIKNKQDDIPAVSPPSSKATKKESFKVRQLTDVKYKSTTSRLKKGEYLTNGILQCFTCHSPRNWEAPGAPPIAGKLGSGGTIVNQDSTSLVIAPNITPDK